MQSLLNLRGKYRALFRPFAPSVLREDVADWFEIDCDTLHMLMVADVVQGRRRQMTAAENALFGIEKLPVPCSDIPAVTHIDYSAQIQTTSRQDGALSRQSPRRRELQPAGFSLGRVQLPTGRPGLRPRVPALRMAREAAASAGLRPSPISLASAERCLA